MLFLGSRREAQGRRFHPPDVARRYRRCCRQRWIDRLPRSWLFAALYGVTAILLPGQTRLGMSATPRRPVKDIWIRSLGSVR